MIFYNFESTKQLIRIFTVFIGFFLIAYIYQSAKKDHVLKSYIFMNLSAIVWTIGLIFENLSWADSYMLRFGPIMVSYLGICSFGFGWLVFCMYLSNSRLVEKSRNIVLLSILPCFFYILLLTNKIHQFVYIVPETGRRSFGWGYYALVVTTVAYICAGIILLIYNRFQDKYRTRYKTYFLLLLLVFIIFNLALQLGLKWKFEVTPLTFILSSILFFYGSVRYNFFSIVPVSYYSFIQSMDAGVLVLDYDSSIVSFNDGMNRVVTNEKMLSINEPSSYLVEYIKKELPQTSESKLFLDAILHSNNKLENSIIQFNNLTTRFYNVQIQPVMNWRKQLLARIIIFSDITEYINLNTELESRNNEIILLNKDLTDVNEELLRQSLMMEEIASTDERNRILKELYHSIEETFRCILLMVDACKNSVKKNDAMMGRKLNEMIQVTKEGLNEIRSSIYSQRNKVLETHSYISTLEKLFCGKYNTTVEFYFQGSTKEIPYHIRYAIYITCQEALENADYHGQAKLVYIILQFKETSLDTIITDNGNGCACCAPGVGLSKIEKLCHELGGVLNYGSADDNQGFSLRVTLPIN